MDHEGEYGLVHPHLTSYLASGLAAQSVRCDAKRTTMPGSQRPVQPESSPTGSPRRLTVQELLADATVEMAVRMTALMFGLPGTTVTEIVAAELPMIAAMSVGNPELRRRLYVASVGSAPERLEDFYARMMASPPVRQAVMDDYKATYGAMLDAVNRVAARQAGTTDGQARDVLAAVLPAVTHVLGAINRAGDEQSFCQCLRELQTSGGTSRTVGCGHPRS